MRVGVARIEFGRPAPVVDGKLRSALGSVLRAEMLVAWQVVRVCRQRRLPAGDRPLRLIQIETVN